MEALAREVGVADHVRFAGRVSDDELLAAYRDADAFVMPSLKEGFGIVYLEAWQHQLPVLAGDRDAGGEVVENGLDGLVVDPTSTQQIADAIVALLTDSDLCARLGAAGRTKLEREYSHERFAERFQLCVGTYLRPRRREDDDGDNAAIGRGASPADPFQQRKPIPAEWVEEFLEPASSGGDDRRRSPASPARPDAPGRPDVSSDRSP